MIAKEDEKRKRIGDKKTREEKRREKKRKEEMRRKEEEEEEEEERSQRSRDGTRGGPLSIYPSIIIMNFTFPLSFFLTLSVTHFSSFLSFQPFLGLSIGK